jgi:hypothetical protein
MEKEKEIIAVRTLGEAIGYGQLMCLASALWRDGLQERGYPVSGAFVPALRDFIHEKEALDITDRDIKFYDEYIK